ncbi:MAG TPA: winged helix-turn-helix domain-containing protein [Propionibacteriaceae bacterium]
MDFTFEQRLAALEAAVAALQGSRSGPVPPDDSVGLQDTETFWLVNALRLRYPAGAVIFAGTASVGKGEVAWQWGAESDRLLEQDWESAAPILDALSHPVRLRLLQRVLNGVATTAELSEDATLGTTGQLHHHLRALVAAGWLQSTGRGRWAVTPQRVIPLLVVVAATTS